MDMAGFDIFVCQTGRMNGSVMDPGMRAAGRLKKMSQWAFGGPPKEGLIRFRV